jgi:hypothetical protein
VDPEVIALVVEPAADDFEPGVSRRPPLQPAAANARARSQVFARIEISFRPTLLANGGTGSPK